MKWRLKKVCWTRRRSLADAALLEDADAIPDYTAVVGGDIQRTPVH